MFLQRSIIVQPSNSSYIDFAELARQCASFASRASLRRWIGQGTIEKVQPGGPGGKLLFPADTVARLKSAEPSSATKAKKQKRGVRAPAWQTRR